MFEFVKWLVVLVWKDMDAKVVWICLHNRGKHRLVVMLGKLKISRANMTCEQ
jgi:hypothetical protein